MKIAVTGASGFIGSEVLEVLKKKEAVQIVALTRGEDHEDGVISWCSTDYSVDSLKRALVGTDAVIHLAATRGTTGNLSDYHGNECITENLLIAMGEMGVKKIVLASSIAVYSDTERIPWKEEQSVQPKTLYGITKASCEYLCHYYSKKYPFHYAAVRIAQVLGLGEKRKGMMNVFLETAAKKGTISVMGKSIAKRQYIYVKDLAEILCILALDLSRGSEIVNVGMDHAHSNLEIAQMINEVFENETEITYDDSFLEKIEASHMDTDYLLNEVGYHPLDMRQVLMDVRKDMER